MTSSNLVTFSCNNWTVCLHEIVRGTPGDVCHKIQDSRFHVFLMDAAGVTTFEGHCTFDGCTSDSLCVTGT